MSKPTSKPVFEKIQQQLTSISGAVERTPNRFTTSEYVAASGVKASAAKDRLNALLKVGRLRRIILLVKKADGTVQPMPAWEYIDEEPSAHASGHESSRA